MSVIVVDCPQRSGRKGFGLYSSSTSQLHSRVYRQVEQRTRRVVGGFELDLVLGLADRNAGYALPEMRSASVDMGVLLMLDAETTASRHAA